MANMYVSFILNLFQPVDQSYKIIDEITRECYLPLAELFNSNLNPKFTLSITDSLFRLLQEYGRDDEIGRPLREAVNRGNIEIIHSGAYYPIFPLITEREVKRQIELDINSKGEAFGITTQGGILPPELCYNDSLIKTFKDLGFRWTIIDDKLLEMNGIKVPDNEIYHVDDFYVFMRSNLWSNRIKDEYLSGKKFVEYLEREVADRNEDCYKIITLAGETFGHYIKFYEETFLKYMLYAIDASKSVHLRLVSELLDIKSLKKVEKHKNTGRDFKYFPSSSWSTLPINAERGDSYPHWKSKGNPIHEKLWELTDLILKSCQGVNFGSGDNRALRELLDQAFYSCQYYWADSIWFWDPREIYQGIDHQMRVLYKYIRLTEDDNVLKEAERIYTQLMWEIFKCDQEKKEKSKQ